MRYSQILRFINYHKIKRRLLALGNARSQHCKEAGICDDVSSRKQLPHAIKDRPQHGALLFGQARLSAKPANVAISFPAFQLPRVNNVVPLA